MTLAHFISFLVQLLSISSVTLIQIMQILQFQKIMIFLFLSSHYHTYKKRNILRISNHLCLEAQIWQKWLLQILHCHTPQFILMRVRKFYDLFNYAKQDQLIFQSYILLFLTILHDLQLQCSFWDWSSQQAFRLLFVLFRQAQACMQYRQFYKCQGPQQKQVHSSFLVDMHLFAYHCMSLKEYVGILIHQMPSPQNSAHHPLQFNRDCLFPFFLLIRFYFHSNSISPFQRYQQKYHNHYFKYLLKIFYSNYTQILADHCEHTKLGRYDKSYKCDARSLGLRYDCIYHYFLMENLTICQNFLEKFHQYSLYILKDQRWEKI